MLITGLAFLLFCGLLALNNIGLVISSFVAALITGIVFVGLSFVLGNRSSN